MINSCDVRHSQNCRPHMSFASVYVDTEVVASVDSEMVPTTGWRNKSSELHWMWLSEINIMWELLVFRTGCRSHCTLQVGPVWVDFFCPVWLQLLIMLRDSSNPGDQQCDDSSPVSLSLSLSLTGQTLKPVRRAWCLMRNKHTVKCQTQHHLHLSAFF